MLTLLDSFAGAADDPIADRCGEDEGARFRGRTAGTQCGSRSWAEIIRFECTLAAAVGNSVISGHPAYNGYHNGIKHNASINVNNNRGARGRRGGAGQGGRARVRTVQDPCVAATTAAATLGNDGRAARVHAAARVAIENLIFQVAAVCESIRECGSAVR